MAFFLTAETEDSQVILMEIANEDLHFFRKHNLLRFSEQSQMRAADLLKNLRKNVQKTTPTFFAMHSKNTAYSYMLKNVLQYLKDNRELTMLDISIDGSEPTSDFLQMQLKIVDKYNRTHFIDIHPTVLRLVEKWHYQPCNLPTYLNQSIIVGATRSGAKLEYVNNACGNFLRLFWDNHYEEINDFELVPKE